MFLLSNRVCAAFKKVKDHFLSNFKIKQKYYNKSYDDRNIRLKFKHCYPFITIYGDILQSLNEALT